MAQLFERCDNFTKKVFFLNDLQVSFDMTEKSLLLMYVIN